MLSEPTKVKEKSVGLIIIIDGDLSWAKPIDEMSKEDIFSCRFKRTCSLNTFTKL